MDRLNPPHMENERHLWHGTTGDVTYNIATYGFNRSFAGKNGKLIIWYGFQEKYLYNKLSLKNSVKLRIALINARWKTKLTLFSQMKGIIILKSCKLVYDMEFELEY